MSNFNVEENSSTDEEIKNLRRNRAIDIVGTTGLTLFGIGSCCLDSDSWLIALIVAMAGAWLFLVSAIWSGNFNKDDE